MTRCFAPAWDRLQARPSGSGGVCVSKIGNCWSCAAADIAFDGAIAKGNVLGDLSIVSPLNLRVDVRGDTLVGSNDGLLGRAANSHAEGVLVCTDGCVHHVDVPEPMSMVLLGSGIMGLAAIRRRRDTIRS